MKMNRHSLHFLISNPVEEPKHAAWAQWRSKHLSQSPGPTPSYSNVMSSLYTHNSLRKRNMHCAVSISCLYRCAIGVTIEF
jgi:hypothetical protein